MKKLNLISEKYKDLPYMNHQQALYIRDIILKNSFQNICELGHFHGKSSIYIASILEEQGYGKLTTFDMFSTLAKPGPSIFQLVNEFSLQNYVNVCLSNEGYIWDLSNLIQRKKEKIFDLVYIDGGHTFESTALAFVLIDLLLKDNGIIIFDDLHWSINKSVAAEHIDIYKNSTALQKSTEQIKMVCDIIVSNYHYDLVDTIQDFDWVVYKKAPIVKW